MSSRSIYFTEVKIPNDVTIGTVNEIVTELEKCRTLAVRMHHTTMIVRVYLDRDYNGSTGPSLEGAPSGTHEFTYGWLAHQDCLTASKILGTLEWKGATLYDNGEVVPQGEKSFLTPFTIKGQDVWKNARVHIPERLRLKVSEGDFSGICDWGNCTRETIGFGLDNFGNWLPICGPCADGNGLHSGKPVRVITLGDIDRSYR